MAVNWVIKLIELAVAVMEATKPGAGWPDGDITDWMGTCYIDRLSRLAIERKRRRRVFGGLHTCCIQWLMCRLIAHFHWDQQRLLPWTTNCSS